MDSVYGMSTQTFPGMTSRKIPVCTCQTSSGTSDLVLIEKNTPDGDIGLQRLRKIGTPGLTAC